MPRKREEIKGVSGASILSLQAQLYKGKEAAANKSLASNARLSHAAGERWGVLPFCHHRTFTETRLCFVSPGANATRLFGEVNERIAVKPADLLRP